MDHTMRFIYVILCGCRFHLHCQRLARYSNILQLNYLFFSWWKSGIFPVFGFYEWCRVGRYMWEFQKTFVNSSENQVQLGTAMSRFEKDFAIHRVKFDRTGICGSALVCCLRKPGTWGEWWGDVVFEELEARNCFLLSENWQEEWTVGWGWER